MCCPLICNNLISAVIVCLIMGISGGMSSSLNYAAGKLIGQVCTLHSLPLKFIVELLYDKTILKYVQSLICILHFSLLHWRHNGHDSVSNHQLHDCLLSRLFRRRSKKISQLRVTGLCVGNSPGDSPHKWPVTRKMFPFDDVRFCTVRHFHICENRFWK